MRRSVARVLAGGVIAAAALGFGGGIASADEVPIWLVPGVDAGPLLDPTTGAPTAVLAPVYGLLTELAG
ncbi:hypothetical protein [Amycolatopsis methanolica]|uniref:hypothetical protein n=1 Tax=Amycolatopsis methanolica TaxID=1814 RepID=UPI000477F983|nr:hypothetical protein [Amycolatopsis methanolica]